MKISIQGESGSFHEVAARLYFEYDDVEAIAQKLRDRSVVFVHEVREQPWRQKVVRFYDPDENIIEVGESMEHVAFRLAQEGLPVERISEITYMPVDYVVQSIEKYPLG